LFIEGILPARSAFKRMSRKSVHIAPVVIATLTDGPSDITIIA
jgi:hypothetical protein